MRKTKLLLLLLAFAGCIKEPERTPGPPIEYTGIAIDDKTGQPLASLNIRVVGHNNSGGVWFGTSEKVDLGTALTDAAGRFRLNFTKWEAAQTFEFYFSVPPGYFRRFFTLDANKVHSGDTVIKFTKETMLRIAFKNTSPVDANDRLSFHHYNAEAEFGYVISPCTTTLVSGIINVDGYFVGGNVEGSQTCPVAADRKHYINYAVRKSGVTTVYKDSVYCARNMTNVYNLNY